VGDADADFVSARAGEVEKKRPAAIEGFMTVDATSGCCRRTCRANILIPVLSNLCDVAVSWEKLDVAVHY